MRVEVLGGLERRRRWSQDDKARIVEETLVPGAKVTEVRAAMESQPAWCLPGVDKHGHQSRLYHLLRRCRSSLRRWRKLRSFCLRVTAGCAP